jgi:histidinol-phosphate aminotransferase
MSVGYKKSIDSINPYQPARSLESVKREFGLTGIIKLAGNENNHGFSPQVKEAIRQLEDQLTRYPDTHGTLLREELSRRLNVGENEILFGNGSFELISMVALAYLEEGFEALIPTPSFGWYNIATLSASAEPVVVPLRDYAVDLDAVYERVNQKTRVVWLCNPNNPTGTYFNKYDLENFLRKLPSGVLVALDEAYIDFAGIDDLPKTTELIHRYPNVISLRTFSKVYGLASLRIGYALAGEEIIGALARIRQPINTNMVAQTAALAALKDDGFYHYVVQENDRGRQLYYRSLEKLGLPYLPTRCNFIMFDTGRDSEDIALSFLKRGIMLRPGKEFGMPTWLRVTIGTGEENKKVLAVLEELLKF